MAAVKMSEIIEKDKVGLLSIISESKRELLNLRFQKASGEMTNTARFKEVRLSIARANTQLSILINQSKAR